jgi:hypothetical protein
MSHRHVSRKLALAVGLGVIAVLATSALAYRTVERVRIGSSEMDRALLYNFAMLDTTPAPGTLGNAYLLNISLLDTSPEDLEATVAQLHGSEDAYRSTIAAWEQEFSDHGGADAEAAGALLRELSGPADEFWRLSNDVVVPAVEQGDLATALDTVFGPMQTAFSEHHALGDRIFTEFSEAQTRQENRTTDYIERQRDIAIVFVLCLCVALIIAGVLLRMRAVRHMSARVDNAPTPVVPERELVDATR